MNGGSEQLTDLLVKNVSFSTLYLLVHDTDPTCPVATMMQETEEECEATKNNSPLIKMAFKSLT